MSDLPEKLRVVADVQDEIGNPGAAFTCRQAAERIVRLEQQLADITGKHDIACFTITDLQKERERLREQLDEYSDVLRGLASYVGCGGYNSYGRIAPKVAGEKIQWGIDHLLETRETELADLEQEAARLRSELDRYRNALALLREGQGNERI